MYRLLLLTAALATSQAYSYEHCDDRGIDSSRIAVAGGSITELIYYLGEQDRIIAVDRTSNYPQQARSLPQIGYVRTLSAEGLLSLKPTLILGEDDMGPPEVLSHIKRSGIDVIAVPEGFTPAGVVDKLRCVAKILSVENERLKEAEQTLQENLQFLASIKQTEPTVKQRAAVILVFTEGAPVAAGLNTAGNGILQMAGLDNALDDMEGWKPLSAESLIKANPDYLIITNRAVAAAGGLDKVYQNPAIRLTKAGQQKRLLQMDGMALLGFGPRTLDAAIAISKFIESPDQ